LNLREIFKYNKNFYGFLIIILVLFPTIFFPIHSDLSIFLLGGKALLEGKKLYVDYIDIKPPLIYYLFAGIYQITGKSEILLRIFDFAMQFSAICLMYFVISKQTRNSTIALFSCIIYALLYSTFNFNQTFQGESFTSLPLIFLIIIQFAKKNSIWLMLLRGILIGFLFSIKFTLGIVFIPILLDDLFSKEFSYKSVLSRAVLTFIGFIIFVLLSFSPLFASDVQKGYLNVIDFFKFYTYNVPFNAEFVQNTIKFVGLYFGGFFSLVLIVFASIGLSRLFTKDNKEERSVQHLINLSFTLSLFLLISVIIEKQFFLYHFMRFYLPISIIAGLGLYSIINKLKINWKNISLYTKFIAVLIVIFLIFESPVPRWLKLLKVPAYYFTDKNKYDNLFTNQDDAYICRIQYIEVAKYINDNKKPGDFVIVMSTGSNPINFFLNNARISRFSQSCFYFSKANIKNWKDGILNEMKSANWIVVQDNDRHRFINGHDFSSWESLQQNPVMFFQLNENYKQNIQIGNFLIFKRTNFHN
jgi:hypothetical protein